MEDKAIAEKIRKTNQDLQELVEQAIEKNGMTIDMKIVERQNQPDRLKIRIVKEY